MEDSKTRKTDKLITVRTASNVIQVINTNTGEVLYWTATKAEADNYIRNYNKFNQKFSK